MKHVFKIITASALLLTSTLASAANLNAADTEKAAQLAKAKACLACHQIDKKVVGPSYKDVATKYSAKDIDMLSAKIRGGTKGTWGPVPMPAQNVTEAEAKLLATWVLDQKEGKK